MAEEALRLADGTPAWVRDLRPDDAPALTEGLERLSPESNYRRFLSLRTGFTERELAYLTACDGVGHIGIGMQVEEDGRRRAIAVARCIRDTDDPEVAEVAVVAADAWQGRGVGTELMSRLASRAWAVGIRRFRADLLAANFAAQRLLEHLGAEVSRRPNGPGVVEIVVALRPPA